jgi:hypothetical protein
VDAFIIIVLELQADWPRIFATAAENDKALIRITDGSA